MNNHNSNKVTPETGNGSTSTNIIQNPINRRTTPPLNQPTNINPFNFNDNQSLKIITHNVQGINTKLKFQLWLEKVAELGAHIISMTETKLPESTTPRSSLSNPLYTIFTANNDNSTGTIREASLGTAIAVHSSIQPYIHTIKQIPGFALLIDFFFPVLKPALSPSTFHPKLLHHQKRRRKK